MEKKTWKAAAHSESCVRPKNTTVKWVQDMPIVLQFPQIDAPFVVLLVPYGALLPPPHPTPPAALLPSPAWPRTLILDHDFDPNLEILPLNLLF